MTALRKAILRVEWHDRTEDIPVQYNPTEFTLDKQAQVAEIAIPGLDAPLLQYVRGQSEKLTMDLFFDTTEHGMGAGATSVTSETDRIYQLIKIEPTRHAPPVLTFLWSAEFPGSAIGGAPGAVAAAAGKNGSIAQGALGPSVGGQRRNGFRCVLESVRQKFTLFSPEGVPLRATLTVSFREYKTLADQIAQVPLNSPDRTHAHLLLEGESLAAVSQRYYDKPGDWRPIADQNGVEDPRRLTAGTFLQIPRVD